MPLYEYKCDSCGKTFEVIQKFSDEPLTVHAECGGPVQRLLSAPAFHLKGTGWYATDYAKGNGGKPAESKAAESKAEGDSGKTEAKSSEPKTETKAAPTESKPTASTADSK
jgi:putative FmdB family regulatory protein